MPRSFTAQRLHTMRISRKRKSQSQRQSMGVAAVTKATTAITITTCCGIAIKMFKTLSSSKTHLTAEWLKTQQQQQLAMGNWKHSRPPLGPYRQWQCINLLARSQIAEGDELKNSLGASPTMYKCNNIVQNYDLNNINFTDGSHTQ